MKPHVLIATSNAGKLRDFAAAAAPHDLEVRGVPAAVLAEPVTEDGATFAENACKKAEHYSRRLPGELVLADDSGLEVAALGGAPGVHSARYAVMDASDRPGLDNSDDRANNARLLRELENVPDDRRQARFVCVIAAARDGRTVATFEAHVDGHILHEGRGSGGFGYDPLFFVEALGRTFGEAAPEEKAALSHRGQAFRKFLDWYSKLETEDSRLT